MQTETENCSSFSPNQNGDGTSESVTNADHGCRRSLHEDQLIETGTLDLYPFYFRVTSSRSGVGKLRPAEIIWSADIFKY